MSKFKVGDRIRRVRDEQYDGNTCSETDIEDEFIVAEISTNGLGKEYLVSTPDFPHLWKNSKSVYSDDAELVELSEDDLEQVVVVAQAALDAYRDEHSAAKLAESLPNGTKIETNAGSRYVKAADGKWYFTREDYGYPSELFKGMDADKIKVLAME